LSTTDAFAKVDKALEAFMSCQQALAEIYRLKENRHVKEERKKGRRREGKKIRSFCLNCRRYFKNKLRFNTFLCSVSVTFSTIISYFFSVISFTPKESTSGNMY